MLLEAKGPTPYSQRLITILKLIAFIQLFLGCGKVFLNFFAGMTDIISSLIIFYAALKLNFCLCSLYVLGDLANMIIIIATIGIYIQNNSQSLFSGEPQRNTFYIMSGISIVFYIVAFYFAYESYREFKAIAFHLFQNSNERQIEASARPPSLQSSMAQSNPKYFENFHSFGRVSMADSYSPQGTQIGTVQYDSGVKYDWNKSIETLNVPHNTITGNTATKFP